MLDEIRALWRDLCAAPDGFRDPLTAVGTDRHRCAPPGWLGMVSIDGTTVVAGPDRHVERLCAELTPQVSIELTAVPMIVRRLRPTRTLGPARLFDDDVDRSPRTDAIGPVPITDPRVAGILADATPEERDEAGFDDSGSGIFLTTDGHGRATAICGWHEWPLRVAHVGVLTARAHRRVGAARRVADHTLVAAARAGLRAQWRAATVNAPSIRLARSLGLTAVGFQLSIQLPD